MLVDGGLAAVLAALFELEEAPGVPFDPATTQGPQVSQEQMDKILGYVELGRKQGAELRVGGEIVWENLDRHRTVEPRVPGFVALAHAPDAENPPDFVPAEPSAWGQSHERSGDSMAAPAARAAGTSTTCARQAR